MDDDDECLFAGTQWLSPAVIRVGQFIDHDSNLPVKSK